MEYFKELLNPVVMPSTKEVEAGDSEEDSAITQAEATKVFTSFLKGVLEGVF